jgi:hypothetical protein
MSATSIIMSMSKYTEPRYYVVNVGTIGGRTGSPTVFDSKGGTVKVFGIGEREQADAHAADLNEHAHIQRAAARSMARQGHTIDCQGKTYRP